MSNNETKFKSIFKDEISDFIKYKRSLGYKYDKRCCDNFKILDDFFVEEKLMKKNIDENMIEKWLKKCSNLSIGTKRSYYSIINMFTNYLVINGYDNITIPQCNPFHGKSSFIPYIYSKNEIKNIFTKSKNDKILYLSLHLLYNCGFRLSEVINLKVKHLQIKDKTILIENSKNNVSRIIPLNDSIFQILYEYISEQIYLSKEDYIFLCNKKRDTVRNNIYKSFHEILSELQIVKENNLRPRVHDLRHTFAVHALEQMQQKRFDLYTTLPILSVYLGHKSIVETEYYLRLIPEYNKNLLTSQSYITNLYKEKVFYEK